MVRGCSAFVLKQPRLLNFPVEKCIIEINLDPCGNVFCCRAQKGGPLRVFQSMNHLASTGKLLIVVGLVIAGLGFLLAYASPFLQKLPIGRLPGDVYYKRDNFVFYSPLGTSLLISAIATLIMYLLSRR